MYRTDPGQITSQIDRLVRADVTSLLVALASSGFTEVSTPVFWVCPGLLNSVPTSTADVMGGVAVITFSNSAAWTDIQILRSLAITGSRDFADAYLLGNSFRINQRGVVACFWGWSVSSGACSSPHRPVVINLCDRIENLAVSENAGRLTFATNLPFDVPFRGRPADRERGTRDSSAAPCQCSVRRRDARSRPISRRRNRPPQAPLPRPRTYVAWTADRRRPLSKNRQL